VHHFCQRCALGVLEPIDCLSPVRVAALLLPDAARRTCPIKLLTRCYGLTTLSTAAAVAAFAVEAVAQSGSGWVLVAPPPVPEKPALVKVYAANSEAEVRAAVDSLPDEEQILLVTKVYQILRIPTVVARTEALLDALQDTSAPVSKWRRIGAFDSAALCEHKHQLDLQSFERAAATVRSSPPESEELPVEEWRLFEGLSACRRSLCVPASAFFPR